MARVTHVKKAQQRYETVPVLDADGKPVKIALTKADGTPKMTSGKRGKTPRPVFITKTVADKTKPKPLQKCGKCGTTIEVGQPYKWIKPKSGPYGGRLMVRCGPCPTWQVWDYSSSLSAMLAKVQNDADVSACESAEDAQGVAENAAQEIRDLAEQKREGASNIEDGFGHATYQSEELEQLADDLDSWADDVEAIEFQDASEFDCAAGCSDGEADCDDCDGTGEVDGETCDECSGGGQVECPECDGTGHDLEEARTAWADALDDEMGNSPA